MIFLDIYNNQFATEFDRDLSNVEICKNLKISISTKYLFLKDWLLASPYLIHLDESAADGMWGICPITRRRHAPIKNIIGVNVEYAEFCEITNLSPSLKRVVCDFGLIQTDGTINSDTAEAIVYSVGKDDYGAFFI